MKMVLIPPGEFVMGSTDEEVATILKANPRSNPKSELPPHRVVITKPFWSGATEVTVRQFKDFVAETRYQTEAEKAIVTSKATPPDNGQPAIGATTRIPTFLTPNPNYEVSDDSAASAITWNDAAAYCEWLSKREKATYRLPTEAEWEYACRAGTKTLYSFGDDPTELERFAWYVGNFGQWSHRVGTRLPNPFGLFDMHGNLLEWCQDYYKINYYYKINNAGVSTNDPSGPLTGSDRIARGGFTNSPADGCRSASRLLQPPSFPGYGIGFRCVREIDASATTASVTPQLAVPAPSGKLFMHDPAFPQWMKDVQAMSADEQIEAVSKKLMELNPGFDGKLMGTDFKGPPEIENGVVTTVKFYADEVTDISPLRALTGLKQLACYGSGNDSGKLSDLSPLKGTNLTYLDIHQTQVSDLTPLRGLKLVWLYCGRTPIADLSPLFDCLGMKILITTKNKVTPAQVAALQKALPNCKIDWDDPAKPKTPQPAASGTK